MSGTQILQWSEPPGARLVLARVSGGFRRLLISDLFVEGLPVILIMCAIWSFAFAAGARVMPFWQALLLFIGLAIAIALLQWALFLLIPTVRITTTHFHVGARRWRNRSIQSWAWETRPIGDEDFRVLVLRTKTSESVRVALPSPITQQAVEQALTDAGLNGRERR
jgi:hypothetical protein